MEFMNVKGKRNIHAALRVFRTLFGEFSAVIAISLPSSETLIILTERIILFIICVYLTFLLEKITHDKS